MEREADSVSVLLIDEGSDGAHPLVGVLSASLVPRCTVRSVPSLAAAVDALAAEPVDVVLLALGGESAADRLVALVAAAPNAREIAHVERELAQAVADLSDAQRIGRMGSWRADVARDAWVWSPELFRLVGLGPSSDPARAPSLLAYVHPEDRERLEVALGRAHEGSPFELEARIVAADGAQRSLNLIGRPDPVRAGSVTGTAQDVTELRAVERALRGSRGELVAQRELLSGVLDHAPIGMAIAAPGGRFIRVNRALGEILGYDERELLKLSFDEIIHPDDLDGNRAAIRSLLAGELPTLRAETRYRHRNGSTIWGELSASLICEESGEPRHIVAQLADMTARVEIERALREERDRTNAIITAMGEGYVLTIDLTIIEVNNALCAITGFSREELLGASAPLPFWPPERAQEYCEIAARARRENGGTFLVELQRKDGTVFEAEITVRAARRPDGSPLGWVSTIRDVSERQRYEAELERLASHDPLTGLANHRVFHQRLAEEMAIAVRHSRPLSVAILDLDHFKQINDRFGHVVGDHALIAVAERLSKVVREGELLARVGGEEFAWVLPEADQDGVFIAAERARLAIAERDLPPAGRLTISIGVATSVATSDSVGESSVLYERADEALYRAKREGRDRTIAWDPAGASVVGSAGADA